MKKHTVYCTATSTTDGFWHGIVWFGTAHTHTPTRGDGREKGWGLALGLVTCSRNVRISLPNFWNFNSRHKHTHTTRVVAQTPAKTHEPASNTADTHSHKPTRERARTAQSRGAAQQLSPRPVEAETLPQSTGSPVYLASKAASLCQITTWRLPGGGTAPRYRRADLSPPEQGTAPQPARRAWPPP